MKMKKKGKVFPSPSSSSSSFNGGGEGEGGVLSVLKLLPAAILVIASVLSLEDREVLAYMITRSINTASPSSSTNIPKKSSKKPNNHNKPHKPPIFDCDCFHCYTSYWYRWDSSPNRELIHQVIEAFEDHLSSGEQFKKRARSGRRRDKSGRRNVGNPPPETAARETEEIVLPVVSSENNVLSLAVEAEEEAAGESPSVVVVEEEEEEMFVCMAAASTTTHKGFARKVLPDVLGLLNSRLWGLWNPNA